MIIKPFSRTPLGRLRIDLRFYGLYAAFTLLLFPVHELAHYLTYRAMGIELRMTLNTASPHEQSLRKPIPEFAGPLLNLVVAAVAAAAYRTLGAQRRGLAALALAAAMVRLVVYVLVAGAALATGSGLNLGNDEPIAAKLWGLPSLTLVAALSAPFAIIVWSVVKTSPGRAWPHVLGLGLVTLGLGMLVGNVLDPMFFPSK